MVRRRLNLRFPRRHVREPDPPEGMNHIEETYQMLYALERHENAARADIDERVATASGTYGWENFSLFVLSVTCLAVALLTGLNHIGWWAYPFGGASVLCAGLILLRWRSSQRARGRGRGPMIAG
ncbi:hypothetical protein [Streptomyces sp. ME19-01-6]|uniref:hypothetical protein n=1 Tax=Streptomyces sp. ME19-01-6 TaxID=3028686 RepID=UPI0029AA04C8|nr:hypothetical protein [Streptomyces sp. ME19-01-6]MDX3231124.1 hypothetical protein [Streptomyces sp. ME19-01-6]